MVEVKTNNSEWIKHLDSLYVENSVNKNNPSFYYYPDIKIEIESTDINLIYRKLKQKTKIFFGDCYGRKVYLSDVDIIKIIVDSEDTVYEVICEILMMYINDPTATEVNFKINDQDFYYKSIIKEDFDKDKLEILRLSSFETTADLTIKYIDLITLINLIINKEFLVDIARGTDRVLRQSKKFLILSKFYKENKYADALKAFGYKTSKKIEEVYYNSSIAKKHDVIFDKIAL
ncbi:hypothetical protein [Bacillus cereus]|uniref:hypothetical protein n=1 Tax=Bacillus cereus TaxID=1396 RepID=UPI000C28532D|nr:hypothetical protein [Bacillus cereus]